MDRASGASWWFWDHGSRPFFWRWDLDYVAIIQDGLKWWIQSEPPRWRVAQADVKDPVTKEVIWKKIQKVRQGWYRLNGKRVRGNGYIESGKVASLTSFFILKKGNTGNFRVVYNGSASGLNQVLWAPWFPLPTISSHLRMVEEGTWMANSNICDMFLNLMLHPSLRQYCGVDVTLFSGRNGGEGEIESRTSGEGVKNKSRIFHIGRERVVPE